MNYLLCFFLKMMQNNFLSYSCCIIMFMLQYLQLLLKLLLHDILRMTTHIDFKYGSITFLKETKQLAKSQHLGIAPL